MSLLGRTNLTALDTTLIVGFTETGSTVEHNNVALIAMLRFRDAESMVNEEHSLRNTALTVELGTS